MEKASRKRKVIAALSLLEIVEDEARWWNRGKTKGWMKRRDEQGYVDNIVTELSIEDTLSYREMMRMSHQDFNYLLSVIEQDITLHQILGGNKVINSKARLTLAIRFISKGESFRSLKFQFRISTSAISCINCQVC